MTPPVPVSANQGDAPRPREPSTIYKLVMTPLLFTSFLISLALVDLRHSALRAHYHADADATANQPSRRRRLPAWLHRIVYRYQRYRYVDVVVDEQRGRPIGETQGQGQGQGRAESPGTPGSPGSLGKSPGVVAGGGGGREAEDYYHSKQRQLMKMEAAEAFEIRRGVVMVLGLVSFGVLWAVWTVLGWGLGVVRVWVSS
ncbi:hypothetical protein C8A00DRAFT_14807 [Chaetomidium leptoderma]|uniref:Uncharacterized protein n=1 Tax=Chaetomidium leptoderma TaxID=669021 RepID=A0AAN6ZYY0_9PEZI|nr:hypothetical protein C8A00DRAFT_14807 [Chaetomidium leptoderma]